MDQFRTRSSRSVVGRQRGWLRVLFTGAVVALAAALPSQALSANTASREGGPSGLSAESVAEGVALSWNAPADDAESVTGYRILRRRPQMREWSLSVYVADTATTVTEFVDTDVEADVRYVYRVTALRGTQVSQRSRSAKITYQAPPTSDQQSVTATKNTIEEIPPPEPPVSAQQIDLGTIEGTITVGSAAPTVPNSTPVGMLAHTYSGRSIVDADGDPVRCIVEGTDADCDGADRADIYDAGWVIDEDVWQVTLAVASYQIEMWGAGDHANADDYTDYADVQAIGNGIDVPKLCLYDDQAALVACHTTGGVGVNVKFTYTVATGGAGTYYLVATSADPSPVASGTSCPSGRTCDRVHTGISNHTFPRPRGGQYKVFVTISS